MYSYRMKLILGVVNKRVRKTQHPSLLSDSKGIPTTRNLFQREACE